MDFMTMMQTRKSIRSYEDKPVAREDLIKIVEVGRLTPSACNSQPWKFIVVDEPEAKAKVCDALQCSDGHTGCTWGAQVPAFIILVEEEAKVVRHVFNEVLKGSSYLKIANYLNDNGYTFRGRPFKKNFTDMLRNEKYTGTYVYNKCKCT